MGNMPEEMRTEIACDVSAEVWGRLTAEHGAKYVDEHHEELVKEVRHEVRQAIDEAERDYARYMYEREQEFLDDYYQETSLGWRQQDLIDRYRMER